MKKSTLPRVSVVMTTYNGARYVKEQISSILNQSLSDLELIIADDGSLDGTPDLLKNLARQDARIRLFMTGSNVGLHKNLERALREVKAPLIAISDQDDIWSLSKLERLCACIGEADAVYSNSLLVDSDGKSMGATLMERVGVDNPLRGTFGGVSLLRSNFVSGHALMFRRELLNRLLPFLDGLMFDQQIAFYAVYGRGICYVDEPLVRHRIHGSNQVNADLGFNASMGESGSRESRVNVIFRSERRQKFVFCVKEMLERLNKCSKMEKKPWHFLLEKVVDRMGFFDKVFFDIRLFFLLLIVRRDIFYPGEKNIIKKCIKYSKGKRYYSWRYRGKEKTNC